MISDIRLQGTRRKRRAQAPDAIDTVIVLAAEG